MDVSLAYDELVHLERFPSQCLRRELRAAILGGNHCRICELGHMRISFLKKFLTNRIPRAIEMALYGSSPVSALLELEAQTGEHAGGTFFARAGEYGLRHSARAVLHKSDPRVVSAIEVELSALNSGLQDQPTCGDGSLSGADYRVRP
jgi:hypothetical protein